MDVENGTEIIEPFNYARDAADINATIHIFEDLLKSLRSSEEVREHKLLHEMHTSTLPEMKQKLVQLINNYQEEDVMVLLLSMFDKIEEMAVQYNKRLAGGPPSDIVTSKVTFTKTTTTTFTYGKTTTTTDLALAHIRVGDGLHVSDNDSASSDEVELTPRRLGKIQGRRDDMDIQYAEETHQHSHNHSHHQEPQQSQFQPSIGFTVATEPGECPICCEDEVPISDLCIFPQCGHQYCKECLCGYFDNLINDNKVLDINCPFPKCETKVEYNQIQQVVTPAQFVRYEEFTFLAVLNADPHVRWCPKPGCGNAVIGDPANSKCECTNPECKYEFCFQCSEPWHQDFSCDQYQEWKAENGLVDKKFSKWAKENTKKCPSCKSPIEKMSGCNHMTCYKCKYEFCWLCNGKYSSNHFDVFNVLGCPGMQAGSKQFGFVKRVGMRALIGSGLVIGGVVGAALAIPVAVIAGPIYGGIKLHQHRMRRRRAATYHR